MPPIGTTAPPPITDDCALFVDFDGTLAGLQDDPDTVDLPPGGARVLERLAARLAGALAVVSGRGLNDLAKRTPEGLWRVGGHGVSGAPPGAGPGDPQAAAPAALKDALEAIAAGAPGARVEAKGPVLALHYRAAPTAGPALFEAVRAVTGAYDGYRAQHGKMVIEAKPVGADKGAALRALAETPPFAGRTPVAIGDDVTDEDMMAAAAKAGGWGVKVGAGTTCARYRVDGPTSVWRWLEEAAS
ncbi:MAG: trehalose-phosphatase [Pseudomonadota bacterium]